MKKHRVFFYQQVKSETGFESVYTTHHFNEAELRLMNSYESFNYLSSDSAVYREWLQRQTVRLDWFRWLVMFLIGIVLGFIGFTMHQLTVMINDFKWTTAVKYIEVRSFFCLLWFVSRWPSLGRTAGRSRPWLVDLSDPLIRYWCLIWAVYFMLFNPLSFILYFSCYTDSGTALT